MGEEKKPSGDKEKKLVSILGLGWAAEGVASRATDFPLGDALTP